MFSEELKLTAATLIGMMAGQNEIADASLPTSANVTGISGTSRFQRVACNKVSVDTRHCLKTS